MRRLKAWQLSQMQPTLIKTPLETSSRLTRLQLWAHQSIQRKDPPSTDISQAIQKLDKIAYNVTEDKQYERFGRYVAAELRQLPKLEAILLQQEIQGCITRSKLSLLDNEQEFHDFTFMQSPNVDALTSTTTSSNEEEDVLQTAMINTYSKDLNESPVAKYRNVISSFVATGIAILITVSFFSAFHPPYPAIHRTQLYLHTASLLATSLKRRRVAIKVDRFFTSRLLANKLASWRLHGASLLSTSELAGSAYVGQALILSGKVPLKKRTSFKRIHHSSSPKEEKVTFQTIPNKKHKYNARMKVTGGGLLFTVSGALSICVSTVKKLIFAVPHQVIQSHTDWDRLGGGRGRRLRAANQLRVNRTALPFSYPHVTPQSQSLLSNRFVRFTL
ncbi:hypothetical protein J6590_088914 [Homalodisca vitripennis]|nr:hypothetical protein J6590_088914 [Homalodisca vitripennis]